MSWIFSDAGKERRGRGWGGQCHMNFDIFDYTKVKTFFKLHRRDVYKTQRVIFHWYLSMFLLSPEWLHVCYWQAYTRAGTCFRIPKSFSSALSEGSSRCNQSLCKLHVLPTEEIDFCVRLVLMVPRRELFPVVCVCVCVFLTVVLFLLLF